MDTAHILPGTDPSLKDPALFPFFEGTQKGELRFPRCKKCGSFTWYPQPLCHACSSPDMEWAKVTGKGKIYTWTNITFPFSPDFKSALPFVIALIEFDDAPGVRFVTNLVEADPEKLYIGQPVEPIFYQKSEKINMPVFKTVG